MGRSEAAAKGETLSRQSGSVDGRRRFGLRLSWHLLRAAWLRERAPEASLRALDAALGRSPDCSVAHKFRADVLVDFCRYEEALGCHARPLALAPHVAPWHLAMGTTFVALRRVQEALGCFEEAVRLDPGDEEALEWLGSARGALWGDPPKKRAKAPPSANKRRVSRSRRVKKSRRVPAAVRDQGLERQPCGLCRKSTKRLIRTECCGRLLCVEGDVFVSRKCCYDRHSRYTLCSHHHAEGHAGDWKTCAGCRQDFSHVLEMYVWYGTNAYNLEKLENPPAYEPTHCGRCGRVIVLSEDAYSHNPDGSYDCDECWED